MPEQPVKVEQPKPPIIKDIYDFSAEGLGQLRTWMEQAGLQIPYGQIVGSGLWVPQLATADGTVSTTSTGYVSLSGGPTLSGLPDGNYLLLYGCAAQTDTSPRIAFCSPSVNGATPGDTEAARSTSVGQEMSVSSFHTAELSNGSNTVELRYRSSNAAAIAQFTGRRLIAIRTTNI